MRIGLLLGGLQNAPALGALAAAVEQLGFDSLWAGDHVAFPAPILDPLQLLACYAAHTQRIQLGTCVYLLALRHPTTVAKMVGTLDFISGGRLVFGVGVGGEFPREFQACSVPVRERGARTNEAIVALRALWRDAEVTHSGRFFQIGPVRLAPPPAHAGGPPVWIGGRSDAALRRSARLGDGYVGYLLTADGFRERWDRIRALAHEYGRDPRSLTGALMAFIVVGRDRETAVANAAAALGAMYRRPMESAAARYAIAGTAAECRAAIEAYAAAGVEHLVLTPFGHGDALLEQLHALADALDLRPRGATDSEG